VIQKKSHKLNSLHTYVIVNVFFCAKSAYKIYMGLVCGGSLQNYLRSQEEHVSSSHRRDNCTCDNKIAEKVGNHQQMATSMLCSVAAMALRAKDLSYLTRFAVIKAPIGWLAH
jgi:hypothetical protein